MRLKQYSIAALIAIASVILTTVAYSHGWYPTDCCSGHDCAPIACEEIIEKGRILLYQGYEFSGGMIKNSQDNLCHVCIQKSSIIGSDWTRPMCIFIQNGS